MVRRLNGCGGQYDKLPQPGGRRVRRSAPPPEQPTLGPVTPDAEGKSLPPVAQGPVLAVDVVAGGAEARPGNPGDDPDLPRCVQRECRDHDEAAGKSSERA